MPLSAPLRVLESSSNGRGDLFTRLIAPVFEGYGFEVAVPNIHKTGRELDLTGPHRFEKRRVLVEAKCTQSSARGTDLNTFAGKIDSERDRYGMEISAYFVSISGFTGSGWEQERERNTPRMTLWDGDMVRDELIRQCRLVTESVALAAALAHTPSMGQIVEPALLIGHDLGWIWAIRARTQQRMSVSVCLVDAKGNVLSYADAKKVIDAARECRDELVEHKLVNRSGDPLTEVGRNYRKFLRREFAKITLDGLPANHLSSRTAFPLKDLYEPLWFADSAGTGTSATLPPEMTGTEPVDIYGLSDLLERHLRVLIKGLPGSGKTTILKWIVVAATDGRLRRRAGRALPVGDWFPVVIRCRQLADRFDRPITSLFTDVGERAEMGPDATTFAELAMRELKNGRLVLLVDGLDEISNPVERQAFARQLSTFIAQHPTCRIVITSREVGYQPVRGILGEDCHEVKVQELTDGAIESMIDRWHQEVTGESAASRETAKRVTVAILDNKPVRRLAGNPLMLTTLLMVHRSTAGELPRQRTVLFAKASEVLLDTWNSAHPPLNHRETVAQLSYAAYHMMSTGKSSVTVDELTEILEQARLANPQILGHQSTLSVGEFLRRVEERTSLLTRVGSQIVAGRLVATYEFKHLTFQEYFAACAIAEGWVSARNGRADVVNLLIDRLDDEAWQEIVCQTAVLAGARAERIIHLLLQRLDRLTDTMPGDPPANRKEPVLVLLANLITCLRDEADILPASAEEAMAQVLELGGTTIIHPPSIGKALHGGRYDRKFRELAFAAFDLHHPDPVFVGGELSQMTHQDLWISAEQVSEYDRLLSRGLADAREEYRLAAALTAMRVAYNGKMGRLPEPPELTITTRMIHDHILEPQVKQDRETLANLWATVWLMQYAPPTDLQDLNQLQLTLAHLALTSTHREIARMAAWALSVSPPSGHWIVSNPERNALTAFAHQHTAAVKPYQSPLSRVRMRAGFLIRFYLALKDDLPRLIADIRSLHDRHEQPDSVLENIASATRQRLNDQQ